MLHSNGDAWCTEKQHKARKHRDDVNKEELKLSKQVYWSDKPRNMCDSELMDRVDASTLKPVDIVRLVKDYNMEVGPNVGTCVCVLCNDYTTENDGKFKTHFPFNGCWISVAVAA